MRLALAILLTFYARWEVCAQLSYLDDEFENASSLSQWNRIEAVEGWNTNQLETLDIDTSEPGNLYIKPFTCTWYADYRGPLLYKEVTSRFFSFTLEVTVENRAGTGMPSSAYSLAGAMIRKPREYSHGALMDWTPGGENYIFLACGNAQTQTPNNPSGAPPPHFEVKNTVNSNSALEISGIPTLANVAIRLVRLDNVIVALYKIPGQNWKVHKRYLRQDFGDKVQVGLVTYSDWDFASTFAPSEHNSIVISKTSYPQSHPDLVAKFEYARFKEIVVPASLSGVDFYAQASYDQLLSFLGDGLDEAEVTGTEDEFSYAVYPNPSTHTITASFPCVESLSLFDSRNIEVRESNSDTMSMADIPSGVYHLRIACKEKIFIRLIVKE